ncbi:MAG: UDP-glucose/GDP-mannose dehydrogenase family protein [Chlamydiota bacterium]
MKLLIIGAGYVGLVTGSCMAEMGHHVTCLDIDETKIEQLRKGKIPFYETGLEELVKRNVDAGRLTFTSSYHESVRDADVCFICVHTPMSQDGQANLLFVKNVAKELATHMNNYKIIVNKSTVPVGTASMVHDIIAETLSSRGVTIEYDVVSNPEFLTEGCAISNCMKPDRVVLGVDNPRVGMIMKEIYAPFMLSHDRLIIMDIPSAEMTKYAANIMLASRVSLMNELAGLCEKVGANIDTVRIGIGSDQRIGYKFIYAGVGFGGSCLPKDLRALQALARENDCAHPMLQAIEAVNEKQKFLMGNKIIDYFNERDGVKGKVIGILGLSFKPDTDDMRRAPSLTLIQQLLDAGASVRLYDPIAMEQAKKVIPDHSSIYWASDEGDAADTADALALVTEWKQFRLLDFPDLKVRMNGHAFFDGRNQYVPQKMVDAGFDYISIGKKTFYSIPEQSPSLTTMET